MINRIAIDRLQTLLHENASNVRERVSWFVKKHAYWVPHHDFEDLCSHGFVASLNVIPENGNNAENVMVWFGHMRVIDEMRRQRFARNLFVPYDTELHSEISDDDLLPSERAIKNDRRHTLLTFVERLNKYQRRAVTDYYFDELPTVQTAKALRKSPKTVRETRLRGIIKLREMMVEYL